MQMSTDMGDLENLLFYHCIKCQGSTIGTWSVNWSSLEQRIGNFMGSDLDILLTANWKSCQRNGQWRFLQKYNIYQEKDNLELELFDQNCTKYATTMVTIPNPLTWPCYRWLRSILKQTMAINSSAISVPNQSDRGSIIPAFSKYRSL